MSTFVWCNSKCFWGSVLTSWLRYQLRSLWWGRVPGLSPCSSSCPRFPLACALGDHGEGPSDWVPATLMRLLVGGPHPSPCGHVGSEMADGSSLCVPVSLWASKNHKQTSYTVFLPFRFLLCSMLSVVTGNKSSCQFLFKLKSFCFLSFQIDRNRHGLERYKTCIYHLTTEIISNVYFNTS